MCSGTARSMKVLAGALLFLLCFGLFISVSMVGREANAATIPVSDAAAVMSSPSSDDRGTFNASMRRVPNGPDPIHNRRAGRFGRPPVRA